MDRIIAFLIRAKQATYAGNGNRAPSCRPNSHDLPYQEGTLLYYDSYLGGNNFIGEEAVWIDNIPYWAMNYSGRMLEEGFSFDFLKEALLKVPLNKPFRGPAYYRNGDYTYKCSVNGDFTWFQGYEEIFCREQKIYECYFHGGLVK